MSTNLLKLAMLTSGTSTSQHQQHATTSASTVAEEIEIVKQWLAQRMFPETLQLFEEEATCSFRRTSTSATEVPSWTCIICDKIFTKKGSAKRHCDTAHLEETAAERVECPQCLQKFNRRDDLYSHIRRIHRDSGGEDLVQSLIHNTTRRPSKRVKPAPAAAAVVVETTTTTVVVVAPTTPVVEQDAAAAPPPLAMSNDHIDDSEMPDTTAEEEEDVVILVTEHSASPISVVSSVDEWAGEHDYLADLDMVKGRYEDQELWAQESLEDGAVDAFAQSSDLLFKSPHFDNCTGLVYGVTTG